MKKFKKAGALMLTSAIALSCCLGSSYVPYFGNSGIVAEASTLSMVYNPTTGENGGFNVKANKWNKAEKNPVSYNGMVLDTADKMESSTRISFDSGSEGTLILVFNEDSAGKSIYIDDDSYDIPDSGVMEVNVEAGSHTVLKDSGSSYLYYMEFTGEGGEEVTEETTEETTETTTKETTTVTTTEETTEATTEKATETTTEKVTEATTEKAAETTTEKAQESQGSSKSWNMSNSEFKNLGILSSSVTVDGLTIKATSAKTVSVKSAPVEVGDNTYNYCLALGGSGSEDYRAVAFDVNGEAVVKVTAKSSGSSTRTLVVAGDNGKELATIAAAPDAETTAVSIDYTGKVYIYSENSGINIYKVQLDSKSGAAEETTKDTVTEATTQKVTEVTTQKATETTTVKETATETTTKSSQTSGNTVSNFDDLVSAVNSLASKSGGGTVYVDAKVIDCTAQLALKSTKGNPVNIVGVKQDDGTYPVLDFSSFRNSTIGSTGPKLKSSGDSNVGVRITGSYYTLENLIIQKAGDNGVQIKGDNANHNTLNNCIVRYNNDAGVQITGGASYNTMRFVYSYRNCDIYSLGGNADGFAPKLGAETGNTFYGCYAWDNSDDGWDSYDKTSSGYTKDLSYEECACWNNGNPDVFTGKYDFENGNPLDTDLFMIELICAQDPSFASNYNKGNFSLPTESFINTSSGKLNLTKWTGSEYGGNPNGFKFGSAYTDKNSVRTVKNCLSFEHGKKGFDNNNSTVNASFENCVSFDNGYNYYIPTFKVSEATNLKGFDGSSKDKLPSGVSIATPSSSEENAIRSEVEATRNEIVSMCNSNIIPGEVYFDIY